MLLSALIRRGAPPILLLKCETLIFMNLQIFFILFGLVTLIRVAVGPISLHRFIIESIAGKALTTAVWLAVLLLLIEADWDVYVNRVATLTELHRLIAHCAIKLAIHTAAAVDCIVTLVRMAQRGIIHDDISEIRPRLIVGRLIIWWCLFCVCLWLPATTIHSCAPPKHRVVFLSGWNSKTWPVIWVQRLLPLKR